MCSDIHDVTDSGNLVYGLSTDYYIMTFSVDDTDIAVYKAGADERNDLLAFSYEDIERWEAELNTKPTLIEITKARAL